MLYEKPINPYVANFFGKRNEILATPTAEGFYTPFGFIKDKKAGDYSAKVKLLFRPEHAEVVQNDDQQLIGTILKVSYYGDHQIVKIADEDGKKISIRTNPGRSFVGIEKAFFYLWKYDVEEAF
jgi:iron(III) transport system ATP-binding protein